MRAVIHLSELHGAATHLAVVAIPVYAAVLMLRRFGPDHQTLRHVEPWLLGAALAGIAAAGVTGLLVWGQAQTTLRGQAFRTGTAHFWLGIALAVVLVVAGVVRFRAMRADRPTHAPEMLAAGVLAMGLVAVQGYLGGRMTYDQGVGIDRAGQLAQTAVGASEMAVARTRGMSETQIGELGFSADGLGCARCHGDLAQGQRGPALAGRDVELEEFRGVHGHGLFPAKIVSDGDFAAIKAYLQGLPARGGSGGGDGDDDGD
jgi:uncharacterized membrane protein